jgi:hypothetical protein
VAQLGARLDGIEEVVGSNPIGSTNRNLPINPLNNADGDFNTGVALAHRRSSVTFKGSIHLPSGSNH